MLKGNSSPGARSSSTVRPMIYTPVIEMSAKISPEKISPKKIAYHIVGPTGISMAVPSTRSEASGTIPWGWSWAGMTAQHVLALGDYDGDGKTDRAIVDPTTGQWFVLGSMPFQIY